MEQLLRNLKKMSFMVVGLLSLSIGILFSANETKAADNVIQVGKTSSGTLTLSAGEYVLTDDTGVIENVLVWDTANPLADTESYIYNDGTTVYLCNANIITEATGGIYNTVDNTTINVCFMGNNVIKVGDYSYGIVNTKRNTKLIVTGTENSTLTILPKDTANGQGYGISSYGDLVIKDAVINATANQSSNAVIYSLNGSLEIFNSNLTVNTNNGHGISASNFLLINKSIANISVIGGTGKVLQSDNGSVLINESKVTANGANIFYAYNGGFLILNSDVELKGEMNLGNSTTSLYSVTPMLLGPTTDGQNTVEVTGIQRRDNLNALFGNNYCNYVKTTGYGANIPLPVEIIQYVPVEVIRYITVGGNNAGSSSEEKEHNHFYEWIVTEPATTERPGRCAYMCAECGHTTYVQIIPMDVAYVSNFHQAVNTALQRAAQSSEILGMPVGAEASYDANWMVCISDEMIQRFVDNPTLSMDITFVYDGVCYKLHIPEGLDYSLFLNDDEEFYGFLHFANALELLVKVVGYNV